MILLVHLSYGCVSTSQELAPDWPRRSHSQSALKLRPLATRQHIKLHIFCVVLAHNTQRLHNTNSGHVTSSKTEQPDRKALLLSETKSFTAMATGRGGARSEVEEHMFQEQAMALAFCRRL